MLRRKSPRYTWDLCLMKLWGGERADCGSLEGPLQHPAQQALAWIVGQARQRQAHHGEGKTSQQDFDL